LIGRKRLSAASKEVAVLCRNAKNSQIPTTTPKAKKEQYVRFFFDLYKRKVEMKMAKTPLVMY
jgi:hypothetical protein